MNPDPSYIPDDLDEIPAERIVLNGWPHGFGSDGGRVGDYAVWLEKVFQG